MPNSLGLPQQRSSSESAEPALLAAAGSTSCNPTQPAVPVLVCNVHLGVQCPVVAAQSEQNRAAHHLARCRPCQHGKTRSSGSSQPAPVGDHL